MSVHMVAAIDMYIYTIAHSPYQPRAPDRSAPAALASHPQGRARRSAGREALILQRRGRCAPKPGSVLMGVSNNQGRLILTQNNRTPHKRTPKQDPQFMETALSCIVGQHKKEAS